MSGDIKGEPQLSPRLTPFQLWAMANNPDWRPYMRLIAGHPNAWPELKAWAEQGARQGFDTVGAAPSPPETKQGLFSKLVKTPIPPAPVAAAADDAPAADDAKPENTSEDDAAQNATKDDAGTDGGEEPEPPASDAAEPVAPKPSVEALAAVADADEAWDEVISGTGDDEENESGEAPDDRFDDVKVRRAMPVKSILIATTVFLALAALILAGMRLTAGRRAADMQAEQAEAIGQCQQAHTAAEKAWSKLDAKTKEADKLRDATEPGQVKDTKTIDTLGRLIDAQPSEPREQCAVSMDAQSAKATAGKLNDLAESYRQATDRLDQSMDGVEKSKLDKAIDQAKRLYDDSAGKVADDKTRQSLLKAIDRRDAKLISTATDQVNESIQAKTKADQEKQVAEDEARRQAEQAQAQQQQQQASPRQQTVTPRRNYNYGGTGGGGNTYKPATPAPAPAPSRLAPAPSTPSKPSGNDGAFVG